MNRQLEEPNDPDCGVDYAVTEAQAKLKFSHSPDIPSIQEFLGRMDALPTIVTKIKLHPSVFDVIIQDELVDGGGFLWGIELVADHSLEQGEVLLLGTK